MSERSRIHRQTTANILKLLFYTFLNTTQASKRSGITMCYIFVTRWLGVPFSELWSYMSRLAISTTTGHSETDGHAAIWITEIGRQMTAVQTLVTPIYLATFINSTVDYLGSYCWWGWSSCQKLASNTMQITEIKVCNSGRPDGIGQLYCPL
jgi:hypothetical protein